MIPTLESATLAAATLFGLAWLGTYLLHSTLFLGAGWILTRRGSAPRRREWIWKVAVLAGVLTSGLQLGLGVRPALGSLPLRTAALEAGTEATVPGTQPERAPRHAREAVDAAPARPTVDAGHRHPRTAPFPTSAQRGHQGGRPRARTAPEARPAPGDLAADPVPEGWTPGATAASLGRSLRELPWRGAVLAAWAGGALLATLALLLAWRLFLRRLRDRREITGGELPALLAELSDAAGLRRRVRLTSSPSLPGPITFGLWRPEICVPTRAETELSRPQQRAMLAHELAHHVRRDPAWFQLVGILERVLFVQPLNRLARRGIHDAAEELSDDQAVRWTGERLALASCLAEIAGWIVGPPPKPCLAPGLSSPPSRLAVRIGRLLEAPGRPETRRAGRTAVAWVAVSAAALAVPGLDPGLDPPATADAVVRVTPAAAAPEPHRAPPLGLRLGYELFETEMGMLEAEVEAFRHELEDLPLTPRVADHLDAIEQRMRRLRARRNRMRELFTDAVAPVAEPPWTNGP